MRKSKLTLTIIFVLAILLAFVFLFPLVWMFFTSFKGLSESIRSSRLLPTQWTFENYQQVLAVGTGVPILRWLVNTAIVTIVGTVLVVGVDVLAAYSLARLNLPFRRFFIWMVIAAMTIPSIVILFPQYFNFREADLLNTFAP